MSDARDRAREIDTDKRSLRAAEWLRRKLPGDERFGDPLSTAGDAPVHVVGRHVSSLAPADRPSAAHEFGLGALQLWQALSERSGRGRGDRPLALMFTDLVGFSSWALKAGDDAALELLRTVGAVVEGAVLDHRGRIVKRLGDGLMAVFDRPEDALAAALDAQDGLVDVEVAGMAPKMRAGIHVGRPRKLAGDYLGVDVNIAARVAETAKGGEVLISDPVADALDPESVEFGRSKSLKADGAPKGLRVRRVSRA